MQKKISIDGRVVECKIEKEGALLSVSIKGKKFTFKHLHAVGELMVLEDMAGQRQFQGHLFKDNKGATTVDLQGRSYLVQEMNGAVVREKEVETRPRAPMPGKILKVLKKKGDLVKKGEALITMEAMKMEHTIRAGMDGVIKDVYCKPGELVTGGLELLSYE